MEGLREGEGKWVCSRKVARVGEEVVLSGDSLVRKGGGEVG